MKLRKSVMEKKPFNLKNRQFSIEKEKNFTKILALSIYKIKIMYLTAGTIITLLR